MDVAIAIHSNNRRYNTPQRYKGPSISTSRSKWEGSEKVLQFVIGEVQEHVTYVTLLKIVSYTTFLYIHFWGYRCFFSACRLSHLTDLNKRASASFTISAAVGASLGRYPDCLNRPMNLSTLPLSPSEANPHQAGAAYSRVAIVVARTNSSSCPKHLDDLNIFNKRSDRGRVERFIGRLRR